RSGSCACRRSLDRSRGANIVVGTEDGQEVHHHKPPQRAVVVNQDKQYAEPHQIIFRRTEDAVELQVTENDQRKQYRACRKRYALDSAIINKDTQDAERAQDEYIDSKYGQVDRSREVLDHSFQRPGCGYCHGNAPNLDVEVFPAERIEDAGGHKGGYPACRRGRHPIYLKSRRLGNSPGVLLGSIDKLHHVSARLVWLADSITSRSSNRPSRSSTSSRR